MSPNLKLSIVSFKVKISPSYSFCSNKERWRPSNELLKICRIFSYSTRSSFFSAKSAVANFS
jgi:hypothetical protein